MLVVLIYSIPDSNPDTQSGSIIIVFVSPGLDGLASYRVETAYNSAVAQILKVASDTKLEHNFKKCI